MASERLSPAQARELFPALKRVAYLNAGGASPLALPVEKAVAEHYRELVERGDAGFPAWLARKEEIRGRLARFIGATAREVAFLPSTSLGMGAVASVLWQRGVREVLTLEGEFPSSTLPFLNAGFTLRVVPPRADGSYAIEDLDRAVRRRTGAVVASAIQYASGFRLDLEEYGRWARRRGLSCIVNAAHGLGQMPIDVARAGVDFLCGTSHKWLFGGFGVGVFFARRGLLDKVRLPYAGWLSVDDPLRMDNLIGARVTGRGRGRAYGARGVKLGHGAPALEAGNGPLGPLFGFDAALEIHRRLTLREVERHISSLQRVLRQGLRERGLEPNAPDQAPGSGICVFAVAGRADRAVAELSRKGVHVSPRGPGIRVSTHVFNNEEDVAHLFWALDRAKVRPPRHKRTGRSRAP